MKKSLKHRALMSLVLSAILFSMPMGAFLTNSGNLLAAYAEETDHMEPTPETTGPATEATTESAQESTAETESPTETAPEDSAESSPESSTEESTEETEPPKCVCKEKCSQYKYDKECPVCSIDYSKCEYVNPNVKITIKTPNGWYNDTAKVRIEAEDIKDSGNFKIKTVEAKIGQNGSWTDITEDMQIEISENCTIYVRVTDQNEKTYEKNRNIKCFDTTKPTLNAAVSDGQLSIKASDTDSGIEAIYVNGYEFTDISNGTLNVRLQQFDASYQYFTITAVDEAGNSSDVYRTQNPYYTDPEKENSNEKDPAEQLPVNAGASAPSSATAQVTEHTTTDSKGNTIAETSLAEQKKQAMTEADASETDGADSEKSESGKEFYTIQTQSEKVFYLIVDRDGDEEMVYFLTEIDENDLLNTTSDNSETLPKNSAATDSAIPSGNSALSNNNIENSEKQEATESDAAEETTEETEPEEVVEVKNTGNPMMTYLIFGGLAGVVILAAFYLKVIRKKDGDFLDEDEDDEDEEELENEDEDQEISEDDFFKDTEQNNEISDQDDSDEEVQN